MRIALIFLLLGCTTPAPAVELRTPDIIEIEVQRAIPFPFTCHCEPTRGLEIEMEGGDSPAQQRWLEQPGAEEPETP